MVGRHILNALLLTELEIVWSRKDGFDKAVNRLLLCRNGNLLELALLRYMYFLVAVRTCTQGKQLIMKS